MKKIKMYLIIIITLFIMFPSLIYAATELGASTQSPVVGTSIYVQLDMNYGANLNIRDVHLAINYDSNYLEFEETVWIQSRGTYSNELGKIIIDKDTGIDWSSGPTLQLKFKVLKEGFSNITVSRNGESHYSNGDVIGQSFAGVSINATKPSSHTLIGTLMVEGYTLQPTFSKTNYQYNLIVPSNVQNITINATKSDSRQTISGTGYKRLSYGDNVFPVVVSAQDGSSRTYTITVHRTDDRNGDTTLRSLSVSDTNIKYDENKKVYEATVSRSVESVLIIARPNDQNATVIGTGRKNLNIGENTFNLSISSSGGKESNYTIIINRSTEELQAVSKSSKLKSLRVNNLVFDLSDDKNSWLYGIGKNNDKLSIEAQPESSTAEVEIIGNENLKDGLNIITIKVREPSESNVDDENQENEDDVTEYTIVVYKNPTNTTLINDFEDLTFTNDIVYTTDPSDSHIIPSSIIKRLNSTNTKLYYNVVNLYNGILYQAIINKNLSDADLDASFKKVSDSPLTYETSLPIGTEILLYLEDLYLDGANVKIYTYNEEGDYTLLTDGITVKNGYITFTTNGDKNYVITTLTLVEEQGPIERILNQYKNYIIATIGCLIVILILIVFINKKRKQKMNNEPLY